MASGHDIVAMLKFQTNPSRLRACEPCELITSPGVTRTRTPSSSSSGRRLCRTKTVSSGTTGRSSHWPIAAHCGPQRERARATESGRFLKSSLPYLASESEANSAPLSAAQACGAMRRRYALHSEHLHLSMHARHASTTHVPTCPPLPGATASTPRAAAPLAGPSDQVHDPDELQPQQAARSRRS